MIELAPVRVTSHIAALLDPERPTMPRAFTVLEGIAAGQVVADDPLRPAT
jgi:hypothetical protein